MTEWISVKDRLPGKELDWVLVQCRMVPEGYYSVPHVAELRRGMWYNQYFDTPFEKELSVEVTHWCEMPVPPKEG